MQGSILVRKNKEKIVLLLLVSKVNDRREGIHARNGSPVTSVPFTFFESSRSYYTISISYYDHCKIKKTTLATYSKILLSIKFISIDRSVYNYLDFTI